MHTCARLIIFFCGKICKAQGTQTRTRPHAHTLTYRLGGYMWIIVASNAKQSQMDVIRSTVRWSAVCIEYACLSVSSECICLSLFVQLLFSTWNFIATLTCVHEICFTSCSSIFFSFRFCLVFDLSISSLFLSFCYCYTIAIYRSCCKIYCIILFFFPLPFE